MRPWLWPCDLWICECRCDELTFTLGPPHGGLTFTFHTRSSLCLSLSLIIHHNDDWFLQVIFFNHVFKFKFVLSNPNSRLRFHISLILILTLDYNLHLSLYIHQFQPLLFFFYPKKSTNFHTLSNCKHQITFSEIWEVRVRDEKLNDYDRILASSKNLKVCFGLILI